MKKTSLIKAASALVTLVLAATPFATAFADDSASSEIVGNLTFVANYDTTKDFTDGHSFLMYTSYQDGEELTFTDLYGYYVPTDEFAAAEKADHSLSSYVNNFKGTMTLNPDLAAKYPDLTEDVWNALTDDERTANYPDVVQAIQNYKDNQCYVYTPGTNQSDSRFKKTSHTFTLNKGEYLTMGDYSMEDSIKQMALDALQYSTQKDKLITDLTNNMLDGHTPEEALNQLGVFLQDYFDGNISDDQFEQTIKDYLVTVVKQTAVDTILPYLLGINFIDGDTTGGLFVNRELWRQIQWQSFDPCHVYSVDITQQQLDDLMSYMNGGDANHYSLAAHNCTTVAATGWNVAVGYVRDASGKNTDEQSALYMDEKDTTYSLVEGLISTPKKAYEVMGAWADQDLGGTAGSWTIVRGVEVSTTPDSDPVTPDADTTPATTLAATGDKTPMIPLVFICVLSGAVALTARRAQSVRSR